MLASTRFSFFFLLTITVQQLHGCHDAFVNIEVWAKPSHKNNTVPVTVNGCIEGGQKAFKGMLVEKLEIKNQQVNDLKRNTITNMPELKSLLIYNSSVQSIHPDTFQNLSNLTDVSIKSNDIKIIESGTFTHGMPISSLDLSRNRIQLIKGDGFADMHDLKQLRLNANRLKDLKGAWFQNTNLEFLDASKNQITKIPSNLFLFTPMLRRLHLAYNDIAVIEPNAFKNINNLEYISLRYNRLTSFNDNIFSGITHIDSLYLSANRLNFLPKKLMGKLRVKEIALDGNPLLCNCMEPIRQWLGQTNSTLLRYECAENSVPVCVFPKVLSVSCNEKVDEEASKEYLDKLLPNKDKLTRYCVRFD